MENQQSSRVSRACGWAAVGVSTAIASFWAYWGIIENFHEGWYFASIWANLALMCIQYLSLMLAFTALGAISIAWPRIGAGLHIMLGLFALWFFGFISAITQLVLAPLALISVGYWFGRPEPRKWAFGVLFGVTAITLIASGAEPAWRILVVGRTNDGDFGERVVQGNGVTLVWAPEGPGWPQDGVRWEEAVRRCRYLTEDGLKLAKKPQDVWRLPTADEAVRSMHRHGEPCGGEWDGRSPFPRFKVRPDKETPLWNVHSKVIYWWTASEVEHERAYIVSYNGQVRPRAKSWGPAYLGFRAVKSPVSE